MKSIVANCGMLCDITVSSKITGALAYEKSGSARIGEAEEVYSKASTAVSCAMEDKGMKKNGRTHRERVQWHVCGTQSNSPHIIEIREDEELMFSLKLFEIHINKHLHEIVLLHDANVTTRDTSCTCDPL
jgi:hypothetical protein